MGKRELVLQDQLWEEEKQNYHKPELEVMDSLDYLVEFCSEDTCMKISWMKLNLYNPVCYLEESFGDVLWYMEIFPLVKWSKVH